MQTQKSHKRKSDGDATDFVDKNSKIRLKKPKPSPVEKCGTPRHSRSRAAPSDDAALEEHISATNGSSSSSSSSSTAASSSASDVDTMQEEKDAVEDTGSTPNGNGASASELVAADASVVDEEAATESYTEAEIATSDGVVADGTEDSQAEQKVPVVVKELAKLPTCPVCFEELIGKIVQCKTGHSICEECYQKLTWQFIRVGEKQISGRICPICKSETYHCTGDFVAQRNFGMEELIASLESECKHGCGLICKGKERTEHMLVCHLRPVSCLLSSCNHKMTTSQIVSHMQDVHKTPIWTQEQVASHWLTSRLFEKDVKSIFIVVKLTENSHYTAVLTQAAHGERKLGFVDLNPNPHKALRFHFALSVGERKNSEPQEHMLVTGDMLKIYNGIQRLGDPYARNRVCVAAYMAAMCKQNPYSTVFTVSEQDIE